VIKSLIIVGLIADICMPVSAGGCEDWARIIDIATHLSDSEKPEHYARWRSSTAHDKYKYRLVLRAIAWVRNGGTSAAAWRLCVSY
jgi:hypothetical protein